MKTYSAKPSEVVRKWHLIDATDLTLGRLSTTVATLLLGKGKPMFTSHIDCGDYVVIINAQHIRVTGNKQVQKRYYSYSGFPGGLKERTLAEQMEKDPTAVIRAAVRGMLPANKLRPGRLDRLKIYTGAEHNHEAQKPQQLTLRKEK